MKQQFFSFSGNVVVLPKARPRLGPGWVYSPTSRHAKQIGMLFAAARAFPCVQNKCILYISLTTNARGDIDNFLKTIMDALQAGEVIKNDKQIVGVSIFLFCGEPYLDVRLEGLTDAKQSGA